VHLLPAAVAIHAVDFSGKSLFKKPDSPLGAFFIKASLEMPALTTSPPPS